MDELTYLRNQLGDVIPAVEDAPATPELTPEDDPDFNDA